MPTLVYINGAETGVVATGATPVPNDRIWHSVVTTGGTPGIDTTGPKNGARCFNIPSTAASESSLGWTLTQNILVGSCYIRFVGSVPTANCCLISPGTTGAEPRVMFQSSDSKIYAHQSGFGASGVAVVADTWYLIDFKFDTSTGTRTCDVQVNGTACAQASAAIATANMTSVRFGKNNFAATTANGNIRYDDIILSFTSGDYPLGEHEVQKMSPNADGTHSFNANDFIRGDAGAAILTSDTDVNTLVDETPFAAIGTTDSIQQNVINTNGYVELNFAAAPKSIDAWAVQFQFQYDADATGASTVTAKENDGGTLRDIHTNADISNTTETFLSECKATAPSGGAYTQSILDALKMRWGFSSDVTGSPIIHAIMLEVAYPVSSVTPEPFGPYFTMMALTGVGH